MKNVENIPDHIFDLFAINSFDELSPTDKAVVLKYMSPTDYDAYAALVKGFQAIDDPTPVQKPGSVLRRIIHYRIPLYQAVAAVVVGMLLAVGITDTAVKSQPAPATPMGVSLADENYPEGLIFDL